MIRAPAAKAVFDVEFSRAENEIMIGVTCTAPATPRQSNVIFIIDRSGSMTSVLESVKLVVIHSCRELRNSKVAVVAFDNDAEIVCELIAVDSPGAISKIEKAVMSITANSSTNLEAGLDCAFGILDNYDFLERFCNNTVILLTDGEANMGNSDSVYLEDLSKYLCDKHRVTLFAMAIGSHCDIQLLSAMTDNLIQCRNKTDAVIQCATDLVGEVACLGVGRCHLRVQGRFTQKPDADWISVPISRLALGQKKYFLLEVADLKCTGCVILVTDPGCNVLHQSDQSAAHTWMPVDPDVFSYVKARLELAEMMNKMGSFEIDIIAFTEQLEQFHSRNKLKNPSLAERARLIIANMKNTPHLAKFTQELWSQDHVPFYPASDDEDDALPAPPALFRTKLSRQTSERIRNAVDADLKQNNHALKKSDKQQRSDKQQGSDEQKFVHSNDEDDDDQLPIQLRPRLCKY